MDEKNSSVKASGSSFRMRDSLQDNIKKGEWQFPLSKELVSEKEIHLDPIYKKDLQKIITSVKHPELFGTELGYGGVLLTGAQGTGKTHFARHLAYLTGADFVFVNYLGDPRYVTALFKESRERAKEKPQIIFIDEIDKYGRRDSTVKQSQEATLQQILQETAVKKFNYNILLIGATNLPDALDPALRRGGGRFGKEIEFYALGKEGRHNVLKVLANSLAEGVLEKIDPGKKGHKFKINEALLSEIADLTHGYTNGDLTELLTETFLDTYDDGERLEVKPGDIKMGLKEVGPSALKELHPKEPKKDLSIFGGLDDHIELILATIGSNFNKDSDGLLYLFEGDTGTGKTALAEAIAKRLGFNFLFIQGGELIQGVIGETTKEINRVITIAEQSAPLVLSFDEFDSLVKTEGHMGYKDTWTGSLQSRLTDPLKGVIFIATVYDSRILPKQIKRRFPYCLCFPKPDENARAKIWENYIKKLGISNDDITLTYNYLSANSDELTGANIEGICHRLQRYSIKPTIQVFDKMISFERNGGDHVREFRLIKELKKEGG